MPKAVVQISTPRLPSAAQIIERLSKASPNVRHLIEEIVELGLIVLDELDGEPDLEPSLGFAHDADSESGTDDLELDTSDYEPYIGGMNGGDDREYDISDYEHSLGWSHPAPAADWQDAAALDADT